MACLFPFYSSLPDTVGAGIYHSQPGCRIAQGIAANFRVLGIGSGQRECPFCFVLGQFQANRMLRGRPSSSLADRPLPGRLGAAV